jgi:hypothetical protein
MSPYRLCLFDQDGHLLAPAIIVSAHNDEEAIARAKGLCGSFVVSAGLLDVERLRIVRYLVGREATSLSA